MNARVLLSSLLAEKRDEQPPVELIVPFAAFYLEDPRICTAVLERTAILASTDDRYERVTRRHDQVHVDPATVEWRTKTATYEGSRLNGAPINQRLRSPWRSTVTAPTGREAAHSRAKSDQRAVENQREIKEAEEKELRLLRRQASEKTAATQEKEPMEIVQREPYVPPATTAPTPAAVVIHEITEQAGSATKICRRCRKPKPRSEFAATGIYGGYCATCEPIEKAERAAARTDGSRPKEKGGRPRKTATVASEKVAHKTDVEVTPDGYAHVVKLLHRRDVLKLELARVNEQLQEALA